MATHRTAAAFGSGILAALAGTATGHLVAAALNPASSPVLAVGTAVVNLTPTPVKVWAVRELGTADKPVLVGSGRVGPRVLAGIAGLLTPGRPVAGPGLLLRLVAAAGGAALAQPAAGLIDAVPAAAAAAVGLLVLARLAKGGVPARGGRSVQPTRRGFLLAAGVVATSSLVVAGTAQWIVRTRNRVSEVVLPQAARPLPPQATGLEERYSGVSRFVTRTADFYRVDTNLTVPVVDVDTWRLVVDGDVDRELSLSFAELTAMDAVEADITMTCVSNEVGGSLVGSARWLGVPLAALLDRAGIGERADQVLTTAVDGFTISTPLQVALDGRSTLVAFGMNGEPLPREHGHPVRMVTAGLYGYVGATKWLERITLTTYGQREAYWTTRQWATDAPIKLSSRVDTPRPLSTVEAGPTVIAGVAWAQPHGVAEVEVRLDGGEWQPARLGPDAGVEYWRQWYLPWSAVSGSHQIAVRATSRRGEVQTSTRAAPFPDGSSGIQEVVVNVA